MIPKCLWFKTADRNLASSSAYKENQQRLLNSEISYRHRHLDKVEKMYESSARLLEEYRSLDLFEILQ